MKKLTKSLKKDSLEQKKMNEQKETALKQAEESFIIEKDEC